MPEMPLPNTDQQTLWNGSAGRTWVEAQPLLDRMFKPFEDLLAAAVAERTAQAVLDVGCGTGAVTIAAAQAIGGRGHAVGIDISAPMLDLARERAAREAVAATFICADAQRYAFEPDSIDLVVSRFGVMFFDDPVAAFANIRRGARDGASMQLIAFRGAAENPFMTTAERAAGSLLSNLPPRRPDGPGQFAFADRDRVAAMLEQAGWRDVEITPLDVECRFPARELAGYAARLGPVGLALQQADESTRARVVAAVGDAFQQYVHGDEVHYTAACWSIGATSRA